jgi:hypothetical protein
MSPRIGICTLAILAICHSAALAQEPKKTPDISLNEVGLEINAYQTLKQFEFSFTQLEQLQKWAKETAQKESKREPAKTSKEYAQKLRDLHKALVANDEDRVDHLNDELDELREKEKPAVDDGVDISDAARKRAPEASRILKPAQLAKYLGKTADDVVDPFDRLVTGLDEVRPLQGAEWKAKRDDIADEISRLVAGLDQKKADKVNDDVVALLIRVRGLKDADFQKQRAELDQAARKVIGNVTAHDVLRNQTELALAELLSNPRLHAVLSVRLK